MIPFQNYMLSVCSIRPNLLQCLFVFRILDIWAAMLGFIFLLLKLSLCPSNSSKEGESSNHVDNVSQCLVTLKNKVFPMFHTELPVFQPVVPSLGTSEKRLPLFVLYPLDLGCTANFGCGGANTMWL